MIKLILRITIFNFVIILVLNTYKEFLILDILNLLIRKFNTMLRIQLL